MSGQVIVPPPFTGSAPVIVPPDVIEAGSTTTPVGTTSRTSTLYAVLVLGPFEFRTSRVYVNGCPGSGVVSSTVLVIPTLGSMIVTVAEAEFPCRA